MGWLDEIKGTIIGLDTAPLIYFIEANPSYLPVLEPFFEAMDQVDISVVTSTVTLLEVLVLPIRQGRTDLVTRYRDILLHSAGLAALELSPDIAETAASLRANYGIRTPDAIQISTAISGGAPHSLTNDKQLRRITEINVLILSELQ